MVRLMGNPLACAVGNAAFDLINTQAVLEGVSERHRWIVDELQAIKPNLCCVFSNSWTRLINWRAVSTTVCR